MPPPANNAPKPAPIAKPAKGPSHLLPAGAGAELGVEVGAGAAAGALDACCGAIVRCLPILPPPPKRFASAEAANKLRQVKAIVNDIKNLFMYSSRGLLNKTGSSISLEAPATFAGRIEQRQKEPLLI
jgi:hypothetical protein